MIFLKGQPFPPETYSRWNGSGKLRTKDCDECGHFYEQDGEERCYWGAAWKRLSFRVGMRLRKCQYADKEGPREKAQKERKEPRDVQEIVEEIYSKHF